MEEYNNSRKPMLTEEELVSHLKKKGVIFKLESEDLAISYLMNKIIILNWPLIEKIMTNIKVV